MCDPSVLIHPTCFNSSQVLLSILRASTHPRSRVHARAGKTAVPSRADPIGIAPVVKRTRPARQVIRPPQKRAPKQAPKQIAPRSVELVTVLDFVRYAVTRFNAAKLVFAHGTADP